MSVFHVGGIENHGRRGWVERLALAAFCLSASFPGKAQSPPSATPASAPTQQAVIVPPEEVRGLQSVYLQGPIQRLYVDAPVGVVPGIAARDVKLPLLSIRRNPSLKAELERTKRNAAQDKALAAFLNSSQFGPMLRGALSRSALFISLPRPGQPMVDGYQIVTNSAGLNNTVKALPAPGAAFRSKNILRARLTDTPVTQRSADRKTDAAKVTKEANIDQAKSLPQYSLEAKTEIYAGAANDRGEASRQNRMASLDMSRSFAEISSTALQDFTAFVSLDSQCKAATLYVLGSMPTNGNVPMSVNFTVEGLRYAMAPSAAREAPTAVTLIDKQNLLPAGTTPEGEASRYFCFGYPLRTPANGVQENFLITYWYNPTLALTHGVALTHVKRKLLSPPSAAWVAIPMTRVQRLTPASDDRYETLELATPGDALVVPAKPGK